MRYLFARLYEKDKLLEILRKFSKMLKKFQKIAKNALFYHIFQITNYALIFRAVRRKTSIVGKF